MHLVCSLQLAYLTRAGYINSFVWFLLAIEILIVNATPPPGHIFVLLAQFAQEYGVDLVELGGQWA